MGPRLLLPVVSPQMEQLCLYSQQWEEAEGVGVGGSMAASPKDHHQEVVSVTSAHGELQGRLGGVAFAWVARGPAINGGFCNSRRGAWMWAHPAASAPACI